MEHQSRKNSKTDGQFVDQRNRASEVDEYQAAREIEMEDNYEFQSEEFDGSVPLANPPAFRTLEARFKKEKPEEVGEAEEKEIVRLLHWIPQLDHYTRPTVDDILQDLWFQA